MSSSEQRRVALIRKLRALLGDDETATLMESLPPEPWSELANKRDIGALRSDVEVLRADTQREFARQNELTDLRLTAQSAQFEALLRERLDAQTKLLFFGMIGTLVSLGAIMIGAVSL